MKIPALGRSRQQKPKSPERKSPSKSQSKPPSKPKIKPVSQWNPQLRQVLDLTVTVGSVLLCLMMLPTRLPGMELLGIAPNWLLIWVVSWSVKRTVFQGALAGIVLGLLQDAMTSPNPSHAISLGIVGMITGFMQKQRFIQEDFISIALIVFGMTVLEETIFASLLTWMGDRNVQDIWTYYQKVALASAILSSLWAPVLYYPLNRWWQQIKLAQS
ncbi:MULTISPECIES: rod shape-determining protein MreD [Tolypothrichaceae]|uniref:Rod shape-determining protein MreD n=1 Tax=Hassallia byssoidea VB512170 TaxID=1304833 RepID=A0A846HHK6_9CYAN|nr:rod shape-determining protein MreD [Hassalia byssoidea]NEU76428.1 rod shape-determining protein MreD [Hassalia byssoidea VB512170]